MIQELEASNHRLEGEVRRLSDNAASSLSAQETMASKVEEAERAAKATARQHEQQVLYLPPQRELQMMHSRQSRGEEDGILCGCNRGRIDGLRSLNAKSSSLSSKIKSRSSTFVLLHPTLASCFAFLNRCNFLQVAELNERVKSLQAACNDQQHQAALLESQLREEVARSAPLHGLHLDRLSLAQLDSLSRLHERGLKQARALQVCSHCIPML